jgi:hypothetical protein
MEFVSTSSNPVPAAHVEATVLGWRLYNVHGAPCPEQDDRHAGALESRA